MDVLSEMPPLLRPYPSERITSDYAFLCGGGRFAVSLSEGYVEPGWRRRVDLVALDTPYGALSAEDSQRVHDRIDGYWSMLSVRVRCSENGWTIGFYGRATFRDASDSWLNFRFVDNRLLDISAE